MSNEIKTFEEVTNNVAKKPSVFNALKEKVTVGNIVVWGAVALVTGIASVAYVNRYKISRKIREIKNKECELEVSTIEEVLPEEDISEEDMDTEQ